jgi:hypothetical protein
MRLDPTATSPEGDGFEFRFDAPVSFGVVEPAYFTYGDATSAGQSIGNKIPGIRVLDADSGGDHEDVGGAPVQDTMRVAVPGPRPT